MNRKINIFFIILILIITCFMHIDVVKADSWCYYKDDNSMIRIKIGSSEVKGYVDIYNERVQNLDGIVKNYYEDDDYRVGPNEQYPVYHAPQYRGRVGYCPRYIIYIEFDDLAGHHNFLAFNEEQYNANVNILGHRMIRYSIVNHSGVAKKDYWTAYQESFEQYIGEEIRLKGCDIIDEDVKKLINKILTCIAILVPIGVIGISTYELAKSLGQGKEDEMKKAQKHLIIRIVVSLLIFLVPTIVNFLFNVVNGLWSESELYTCDIYGESIGDNSACYYCHNLPDGKRFVWGFTNILNEAHTCHETSYTDVDNCLDQNN